MSLAQTTSSSSESTALENAIDQVSGDALRIILKDICELSPKAREIAIKRLLENDNYVSGSQRNKEGDKQMEQEVEGDGAQSLPTRYLICVNCKRGFVTSENTCTSCVYHPGEPLYDTDELDTAIDLGLVDDENKDEHLRNFPDMFVWNCCEQRAATNPNGCIIDWHVDEVAHDSISERARV